MTDTQSFVSAMGESVQMMKLTFLQKELVKAAMRVAIAYANEKCGAGEVVREEKLAVETRACFAGAKIGRLTVLSFIEPVRRKNGRFARNWLCICECGKSVIRSDAALNSKVNTPSCGCLLAEKNRARNGTHCLSRSSEYNIWKAMLRRCREPSDPNYRNYGGRGISVCDRWSTFENFYADMGVRPDPLLSVDRVNNDGNYEPGNCKWATRTEQSNNRRVSRKNRVHSALDGAEAT